MKIPVALAFVSVAVCCGGGPSEPVPTPAAAPVSPPDGPLVFVAAADNVCDVALLDLATRKERDLGAFSDCPERLTIPGAPGYVMDERGVRWPLADRAAVGDGKVIEPPPLPELADLEHPESVAVAFELGRDGVVRARRTWGTGEVRFEEGPSYAGAGSDAWSLVGGAWVAGGEAGPGPATVTLGEGAVGEQEPAPEVVALLAAKLRGATTCGWHQTVATPPVAWPLGCGEAGDSMGPLFVQKASDWVRIPGTDGAAGFEVDQRGRWLILRSPGEADQGKLIDLDMVHTVRSGARMWFWTASWAPTGKGSDTAH